MTTNAINYLQYKEGQRSNLAREIETNRSNLAKEAETKRANIARETEDKRHNTVSEALQGEYNMILNNHYVRQDVEQARSNRANEVIVSNRDNETIRHNIATELENERSNKRSSLINYMNAETNRYSAIANATINFMNAGTNRLNSSSQAVQASAALQNARTNERNVQNQYELGWQRVLNDQKAVATNAKQQEAQQRRYETQSELERQMAPFDVRLKQAQILKLGSETDMNYMKTVLAPFDTVAKTAVTMSKLPKY